MKMNLYSLVFVILYSCSFSASEKSKNELEYDSLVNIIEPEVDFLQNALLQTEDPIARDSSLMLIDDVTELSYPEIKDKYDLRDSLSERGFLDALKITAEIIAVRKELEKLFGH